MDLYREFLLDREVNGCAAETLVWYERRLRQFRTWLGETDVRAVGIKELGSFLNHLEARGLSPATVNGYHRALKAFFSWLAWDQHIPANPFQRLRRKFKPVPPKITFTRLELARIFRAFDQTTFYGHRDSVMCRLLLDAGLRTSELLALRLEDVDLDRQLVYVRKGKGSKAGVTAFGKRVKQELCKYLRVRDQFLATLPLTDLWFPNREGQALRRTSFSHKLRKLLQRLGIEGKSAHTFRHTCIKQLILNGADALTVQSLARHTDLATTKQYFNLLEEELQAQHARYSPMDRLDD